MRKDWEVRKWKEVLEVRSGKNQKAVLDPEGKYPIYGSGGTIMGFANDYICEEGTTIIGRKGTIDNPIYMRSKFWNVDTAFGLVSSSVLDSKFLYYFCKNFNFKRLNKGTTLPSLVKKDLVNIEIPIPPLEEQKKIVEKLEKVFKIIDKAKANIEKNIANSKELFQSKLNEIFSFRGEGWEVRKLGDVAKIMYGYTTKASLETEGPYYLRITDIQNNNVDWRSVPKCKIDETNYLKYQLEIGDIVFARTGATTGKSLLIKEYNNSVFASYLIRVKLNTNQIDSRFISMFFNSPQYWNIVNKGVSGSAQGGFNAKKLSELRIPIPPLKEQKEIVENLNKLSENIERIKLINETKLINLQELKKSILQKAFKGELTKKNK